MTANLGKYQYNPLQGSDIRLVELLPAAHHDDQICVNIKHTALDPSTDKASDHRLSRKDLQKTLPQGWDVFETPEGKYLFCYDPEDDGNGNGTSEMVVDDASEATDGFRTTWNHPDTNFDRTLYELPPDSTIWAKEPRFEALSYAWGAPDNPGVAYIQPTSDNSEVTTLPIGKNLEAALRHLRSASVSRTLWIDAICINQNDDADKAVQVARMADVYSQATRVVVWLGPSEDDSDVAVSTLAHLGAQVETTLDAFRLTSPGAEEEEWYDIDFALPYTERQWKAIQCLISRPWFVRVWTAQEIQLANRLAIVQVGSATMSWSLFRRAVDCLKDKPNHGEERLSLSALTSSVINAKNRPLVDLFRRYTSRDCSIAHDKVYGILAMVPLAFAAAIQPNYTQSVSKTYAQAFALNTKLLSRWDLFGCDVVNRTKALSDAPSWVPDFAADKRHTYFSGLLQFSSGNSRLDFQFVDSDQFNVRGVRCAIVRYVGRYCPFEPRVGLDAIRSWEPGNLPAGTYITGEPLLDVFLKTLLQNDLRERNPTDLGWPNLNEWNQYCRKHILSGCEKPHLELNLSYYLEDMLLGRCAGRVFVETDEGYSGLGPKGCKPGK